MRKYWWIVFLLNLPPLFAQQKGSIQGVLLDSLKPLSQAEVVLFPQGYSAITDSNGVYHFTDIPFGKYTLSFQVGGYSPSTVPIELQQESLMMDPIKLQLKSRWSEIRVNRKIKREALDVKKTKESLSLVAIKSKESLDKLPNKSAADLASRMPSVLLFRSKGEGNMVSLRGTPTEWTSVLVDGDRLPVACEDNTTRSFEFEAFPSDFVDEVVEHRSITPDFESDNIGGSLNFLSLQPAHEKVVKMDGSLGYNFKGSKPSGDANVMFSNLSKNKAWQYLINATYFGRTYASEAVKTIYGSNLNHGVNRLELRKYDGFRSTVGLQTAVIYTPSEKWQWKFNAFWGRMTDDKHMNKISFNWYEDNGQRIRLQNCIGKLIRQIEGSAITLTFQPSTKTTGTFRWAGYMNEFKNGPIPFAKNDPRNGFFITEFQSPEIQFTDFSKVSQNGESIDPNSQDFALLKLIGKDNPYGNGDDPLRIYPHFTNDLSTSDFEFTQSYTEINKTRESDPIVFRNDWEHFLRKNWSVQAGVKYRFKVGSRSLSKHEWFQDFSSGNSSPIRLSEFTTQPFQQASSMFLSHEMGNTYNAFTYDFLTTQNLNDFPGNQASKLREVYMTPLNYEYYQWVGSSYTYREHQSSGYLMTALTKNKFALLTGIRVEHTFLRESSDTLTAQIALDTATNTYYNIPETRTIRRSYLGILPSLNFNYYVSEKSILRFAASRTMHRPSFEETKPGHAVIRYNEMVYTFGNPNLMPVFSYNVDVAFEHYHGSSNLFTVGIYYKNIRNHIYTLSALNTDPISGITIRKYANASNAWVGGIELLYNRTFDFLPGLSKNLGIRSNLTLSISHMQIDGRPSNQALTKNTPLMYSFNLFYEGKKWSVNAALLYTSRYVSELNLSYANGTLLHKNSDYDTYANQNYALEGSVVYAFAKHWELEAQCSNLLNFPERMSLGAAWRSSYVEYYGARIQLGIHYTL